MKSVALSIVVMLLISGFLLIGVGWGIQMQQARSCEHREGAP
jgi:hypothetical protein